MKSLTTSLQKRPDFSIMSTNDVWLYIQEYMDTRCTVESALIRKVPHPHREDIRQDAMLDLWTTYPQYDPTRAGYSTFAYIRIRKVVNLFLKKYKRDQKALYNKGNPHVNFPPSTVELELIRGEYDHQFSPWDQEVISRRNAQDQSFKVISTATGRSIKEVKDILRRSEEFRLSHI